MFDSFLSIWCGRPLRTWCSYVHIRVTSTSTLCQIRNEQDWTCEIRFAEETDRKYCAIYYRSCCCWTTDACIVWGFHHNHFRILIKYQQWRQSPMCPGCCAMTALCLCLCFLTQVTSVSSWPPAPVSLSREFASLPWPRARATKSPPSAVGPGSQETVSLGTGCLSVKTRSVVVALTYNIHVNGLKECTLQPLHFSLIASCVSA